MPVRRNQSKINRKSTVKNPINVRVNVRRLRVNLSRKGQILLRRRRLSFHDLASVVGERQLFLLFNLRGGIAIAENVSLNLARSHVARFRVAQLRVAESYSSSRIDGMILGRRFYRRLGGQIISQSRSDG